MSDPVTPNHVLELFGYRTPSPDRYQKSIKDLQRYLDDVGIKNFSAKEIATPYHPDIAKKQGWSDGLLIPPPACWPHGAACLAIAEKIRTMTGRPLLCANWYRPDPYNAAVAGSSAQGDHPSATAIDIQFTGSSADVRAARAIAVPYLQDLYRKELFLALGLYGDERRIHIGVCTGMGKRKWGW